MNLNQFDQVKLFLIPHPFPNSSLRRGPVPFIRPATTAKQEDRDLWRSPFDGIKIMFRPFLRPSSFLPSRPLDPSLLTSTSLSSPSSRSQPVARALISDYFEPPPGSGINSRKSWLICKRRQRQRRRLSETIYWRWVRCVREIKINGYFHQGRLAVTGSSSYSLSSFNFYPGRRWRIS